MHRAAGGTIQRLNAGLATEWLRSKIVMTLIERFLPYLFVQRDALSIPAPTAPRSAFALPASATAFCRPRTNSIALERCG
jgi:hypothetical protein